MYEQLCLFSDEEMELLRTRIPVVNAIEIGDLGEERKVYNKQGKVVGYWRFHRNIGRYNNDIIS